jgi:SHS2 domain-containing protein
MKPFEQVEHTADLALRVWGKTPAELLSNAVRGLCSLITDPRPLRPVRTLDVDIPGDSLEDVLVELLNEMLFQLDARQFLACGLEVRRLEADALSGSLHGLDFTPDSRNIRHVVKAATYHGLEIRPERGGLAAVIVFDT